VKILFSGPFTYFGIGLCNRTRRHRGTS